MVGCQLVGKVDYVCPDLPKLASNDRRFLVKFPYMSQQARLRGGICYCLDPQLLERFLQRSSARKTKCNMTELFLCCLRQTKGSDLDPAYTTPGHEMSNREPPAGIAIVPHGVRMLPVLPDEAGRWNGRACGVQHAHGLTLLLAIRLELAVRAKTTWRFALRRASIHGRGRKVASQ